jgi:hypothetical protein
LRLPRGRARRRRQQDRGLRAATKFRDRRGDLPGPESCEASSGRPSRSASASVSPVNRDADPTFGSSRRRLWKSVHGRRGGNGRAAGVEGEAGTTELQPWTARREAELHATSLPRLLQYSTAARGNCRSSLRKGSGCATGVLTLLSDGFLLSASLKTSVCRCRSAPLLEYMAANCMTAEGLSLALLHVFVVLLISTCGD